MVLKLRKVFMTALFGWSQYPPSLWRWTSGCSWMSSSAVWLVLSTCSRTSQTWCSPYSGLKHKHPYQRAWQGPSTFCSCCQTSCRWGSASLILLSNQWVFRVVVSAVLSAASSFLSSSSSMISDIREERENKRNRAAVITLKYQWTMPLKKSQKTAYKIWYSKILCNKFENRSSKHCMQDQLNTRFSCNHFKTITPL